MFRGRGLVILQTQSLLGALAFAVSVFCASQTSAIVGYLVALSALLMIVIGMYTESIWPTSAKRENPLVFSMFWGLMIGALLPFLVGVYLNGGLSAVYEIFKSSP